MTATASPPPAVRQSEPGRTDRFVAIHTTASNRSCMMASVLLVEDDPNISRLLEIYLARDFDIRRAGTAQDAMEAIAANSFDIALLDITLPDRPGWDLLTLLRNKHPATKILVMTGRPDAEAQQRALAMGAQRVCKPITPAEVKTALQALL